MTREQLLWLFKFFTCILFVRHAKRNQLYFDLDPTHQRVLPIFAHAVHTMAVALRVAELLGLDEHQLDEIKNVMLGEAEGLLVATNGIRHFRTIVR